MPLLHREKVRAGAWLGVFARIFCTVPSPSFICAAFRNDEGGIFMQFPLKTQLVGSLDEFRRPRSLVLAGLLSAAAVVMDRLLTIPVSPVLEIGFAFLATALCAYLCGPWVAGTAGIAVDILSYFLRPNGAFFFGFTLNQFLLGFIYGLWLYKRRPNPWLALGACLTVMVLINFLLTPLWLNIMYGKAFVIFSTAKIIKNILKLPIDVALLYGALRMAQRAGQRPAGA